MADRAGNTHLLTTFEPDGAAGGSVRLLTTFEPEGAAGGSVRLLTTFEPEGAVIGEVMLLVEFVPPLSTNIGLAGGLQDRRPLSGSFARRRRR
tara:strand:- start:2223 stop:2501 length:279 start_codon:yes stop_codon:yes gene_type:complete